MNNLVGGGPLIIEDLDLSGIGLYIEAQKDPSVSADDWFLTEYVSLGRQLWARKSEQGIKWHIFEDKEIMLLKK